MCKKCGRISPELVFAMSVAALFTVTLICAAANDFRTVFLGG